MARTHVQKELPMLRPASRGLTLIELLVVLTLVGIIAGIAVPAFTTLARHNQHATATQQLLGLLQQGRALALARRTSVSLCNGQVQCVETRQWRGQILLFEDPNRNGSRETGETLHKVASIPEGLAWQWSNARSRHHMTYKPNGMTPGLNGTWTLCRDALAVQQIVISLSGRARIRTPHASVTCS